MYVCIQTCIRICMCVYVYVYIWSDILRAKREPEQLQVTPVRYIYIWMDVNSCLYIYMCVDSQEGRSTTVPQSALSVAQWSNVPPGSG